MNCPNCKNIISSTTTSCPKCGHLFLGRIILACLIFVLFFMALTKK
jgi:hypothetical protein